jgi:hypothetical protein
VGPIILHVHSLRTWPTPPPCPGPFWLPRALGAVVPGCLSPLRFCAGPHDTSRLTPAGPVGRRVAASWSLLVNQGELPCHLSQYVLHGTNTAVKHKQLASLCGLLSMRLVDLSGTLAFSATRPASKTLREACSAKWLGQPVDCTTNNCTAQLSNIRFECLSH